MNFINGKKVWLFLMLVMLMVSSFYLWQSGQRQRKVYAGGRVVELQEGSRKAAEGMQENSGADKRWAEESGRTGKQMVYQDHKWQISLEV